MELKKLFSSWYMYICFLIVIAFFAVFAVNAVRSRSESDADYETLLSEINESEKSGDEICMELYNKCDALNYEIIEAGDRAFEIEGELGGNLMMDYFAYQKAYNLANYIYIKFPNERTYLVEDAIYNIVEQENNSTVNEVILRTNEKVIEKYNRKIDLELVNVGKIDQIHHFFDNTGWEYVFIAFIIMMTVRMFTMDFSCGTYKMVFTSKKGQHKLFVKQLASILLIVTGIAVAAALVQLIVGIKCFNIGNLSAPIQSYSEYEFCPYLISIRTFLLIKLLCKLIFYYTVVAITAMISVLFRKQLPSLAVGLIITLSTYFYNYTTDVIGALTIEYRVYNFLRSILPQGLLNIKSYFNSFDYINVLGTNINRLSANIFISVFIITVCFAISWIAYAKPRKRC